MPTQIISPFHVFTDQNGKPLESGYIYIGSVNQNAEQYPIAAYWDEALTIPAAQPIRTHGGYPSRSGSPSVVFASESDYSITIRDKNGKFVFSAMSATALSLLQNDLADPSNGANMVATQHGGTVADALVYLTPAMFGAIEGSDASDAFDAMQAYIAARLSALDAAEPNRFGLAASNIRVDLTGKWLVSRSVVIWPAVEYHLPSGSYLRSATTGMTVVRAATREERQAVIPNNFFEARFVNLLGGGMVDGADIASIGTQLETVGAQSRIEWSNVRCSYRRWASTITGTSASAVVTIANADGVNVLDVLDTSNDTTGRFFTIIDKSGATLTLDRALGADLTDYAVKHRAVGLSGHMLQQTAISCNSFFNDIGEFYGANRGGMQCTDIKALAGMCHENNVGIVLCASGFRSMAKTVQKNFGFDVYVSSGVGNKFITPWIESPSDSDADTIIPPGLDAPIGNVLLRSFPNIFVSSGASSTCFSEINWPTNTATRGFRRLLRNEGQHTLVDGVSAPTSALLENPDLPGDYAPFVQHSARGQLTLRKFRGPSNVPTIAQKLVVDEAGGFPANSRASWSAISNSKEVATHQDVTHYMSGTGTVLDFIRVGDSNAMAAIGTGGLYFGDGASAEKRALFGKAVDGTFYIQSLLPLLLSNTNVGLYAGAGSPEGVVTANPGSMYIRSNGGAGEWLYIKASGVGSNTGWAAKL